MILSAKSGLLRRTRAVAFHLAGRGSARLAKRVPIADCPAWAAFALQMKVPRRVQPRAQRSPSGSANIKILLRLLDETAGISGDVAECGVYRGATLLSMGLYLQQRKIEKTLFGFDSFQGFDESVQVDLQLGGETYPDKRVGGLGNTSYKNVWDRAKWLGLTSRVRLTKGRFEEALPSVADRRFSFVHLDCDLYESYRTCLEFFYPRLARGGIVLLDEYNDPPWPGCNKAVDEFLADKPETLVECESDNYQKWCFRKI